MSLGIEHLMRTDLNQEELEELQALHIGCVTKDWLYILLMTSIMLFLVMMGASPYWLIPTFIITFGILWIHSVLFHSMFDMQGVGEADE